MATNEAQIHYTVNLQIHKTSKESPATKSSGYQVNPEAKPAKTLTELVSVVVRSSNLADLIKKTTAHLALVEEE